MNILRAAAAHRTRLLKAHAAIENVPLPTICIQSYFATATGLRGSQDLVGGGKRQEGGGVCHNYFPTRFWRFFRVRVFPVTRFVLAVWTVTPAARSYPDGVTAMRWTDKRVRSGVTRDNALSPLGMPLGHLKIGRAHV